LKKLKSQGRGKEGRDGAEDVKQKQISCIIIFSCSETRIMKMSETSNGNREEKDVEEGWHKVEKGN
jgi:hypothetical protein